MVAVNLSPFSCKCVTETLEGLCEGLCRFSGPSRAAVIYSISPEDSICCYDPENLLHGHEPKFKELYLDSDQWQLKSENVWGKIRFGHIVQVKSLDLAGLISFGGRSSSVLYQMWFTDHHPNMCSIGPTERWLEHAAWRFSHDVANEAELYTGISGSFLREYATHAVRDHLIDEMNILLGWDTQIRVYPILDALLEISRTLEEKNFPRGNLIFVEPKALDGLNMVARFPQTDRPRLENYKHVRKLLQAVEDSGLRLVSDGQAVMGVAADPMPGFYISADFHGPYGFLRLNGDPVCSFSDGRFRSTTFQAKLVQVEEAILETDLEPEQGNDLFKTVGAIVHWAQFQQFGCTIVIDLKKEPIHLSGQALEQPLDLGKPDQLDLAKSLAKVDGALHIGRDLHLYGFACLLDGPRLPKEDRSRGARYNSALRFTADNDDIVVVVVSVDRPVSVIRNGSDIGDTYLWSNGAACMLVPETLRSWIEKNET